MMLCMGSTWEFWWHSHLCRSGVVRIPKHILAQRKHLVIVIQRGAMTLN